MNAIVKTITPGSPAAKKKIAPGDALCKINGETITDVLDYEFQSYDSRLKLEFTCPDGKIKLIELRKPEGADLGIEFETYLMDNERNCENKCIFCFIDQLPKDMRKTLYYKDDDVRLSFLQGNYVTLTNLSHKDVERIIKLRISPINVSIHTLDPELRSYMLGGERGGTGIDTLKKLANAGITLNCQIVCCPGINDGWELSKTIEGFIELGSGIKSVSVVPVGLTKHRQGLTELQTFTKELALQTTQQVEHYGEKCLKSRGSRVFFCADELYMMAELELPANDFYEDYPQLENGVGMMRLFITEFEEALNECRMQNAECKINGRREPKRECTLHNAVQDEQLSPCSKVSLVTGVLAQPYLIKLLNTATKKYDTINGEVYAIENKFFGESVTVSGLITGGDMIEQLKGKHLGTKLLIPQNMLRHGEDVFLDDVTVKDVSEALGINIRVVKQDGADLVCAILGQ